MPSTPAPKNSLEKNPHRDFPGGAVVKTRLPAQGAQVQPLVGELRSHMLPGAAKKTPNKQKKNKPHL